MFTKSRRPGFRASALALLSLTLCASCDLANGDGGPGPGPGSPGSVSTASGLGSGTFRASFKGIQPEPNGPSYEPHISGTGRYVVFYSYADNLVAGDTNFASDIFVRDRDTNDNGTFDEPGEGTTVRVSVASDGSESNFFGDSYYATISADGRFVAFISYATNLDLVNPDTNGTGDIYVHDRCVSGSGAFDQPGNISTTLVSVATDGTQSNSYSDYPDISDNGRYVSFYSYADNLDQITPDTNFSADVFVHDRDVTDSGTFDTSGNIATYRASVSSTGIEANYDSYQPSLSGDGLHVAFYSYANNLDLVMADTNGNYDVFVHDFTNNTTVRVSVADDGSEGNAFSFIIGSVLSFDGRYITFASYANNLVAGDTNSTYDVFVHDRDADQNGFYDETAPGQRATIRVSVATGGAEGNSFSYYSSISDDGDHVAYFSYATNLVSGDTNGYYDVFVHDVTAGTTARCSVSSTGVQGNGYSYVPNISSDGRMISFYSTASNLIALDTNGNDDCFVHDRDYDNNFIFDETAAGATKTVRASEVASTEPDSDSLNPSISGDGNLIAFESDASDIIATDTNFQRDIFVRDVNTAANARASISNSGGEASGGACFNASMSSDGRFVAFESTFTNLVTDTNGVSDIFLRSLSGTVRVSVTAGGTQATGASRNPSVSQDGSLVAFETDAENLDGVVSGGIDPDATTDIYVRNTTPTAANTTLVSRASGAGVKGNAASNKPSISADGRFIAFESLATNLVGGDGNLARDIFVRDLVGGATVRVSVDSSGAQSNGASRNPSISGDGRFVVFESDANNLVPGDSNGTTDIFVMDRDVNANGTYDEPGDIATTRVSVVTGGGEATGGASTNPVISEDGRFVAFQSAAPNLATGIAIDDTNGTFDVFRHEIATATTILVSENTSGVPATGASTFPAISADGSFVVFQSPAPDLVSPPGASHTNIYRRGPM
jgi:cold shock CspA family protein